MVRCGDVAALENVKDLCGEELNRNRNRNRRTEDCVDYVATRLCPIYAIGMDVLFIMIGTVQYGKKGRGL